MIALAGLFIIDVSIFRSMAIGTIGVMFVAVVGSLTFLPATLAILGDGVNRGRIPFFGREREEGSGLWSRLVGGVMRRPLPLAWAPSSSCCCSRRPRSTSGSGSPTSRRSPKDRRRPGDQAAVCQVAAGSTENLQVAVTELDSRRPRRR